ncbi:proton-coupled folate transporter [Penaeus vannamei]|uniref:proton-coupled folate transporter n=1 Tax=Penaeus vannamei TaxID=6689 RepID=UPI00387F5E81
MKPFRHVLHINKDEKQPQGRRPWATAVGPLFFLKKFSEGLSSVAKDDFRRDRFCRSIANLTQEDCDVIAQGNHTEAQETIDQWESSYHLYELLVSTFIPLVLVLVLAGWSDRYLRRRLVLLVPLVGTAVAIFVDLLLVAFPRWSLEFLYLDPLLTSLGGGPAVFEMAAYALAADTSDSTSRTHSLGRLTNLRVLGTALGTLSGLEIQRSSSASPAWTFATSLGLEVLGLLYVVLVLEEEGGGEGDGGGRGGEGGRGTRGRRTRR